MRATAWGSRALAPSPYTVSVGNATNSPRRIFAAASLIERLIFVGGRLAGLPKHQIGVDQRVEIAIQHAVDVADGQLGAMVLDHPVGSQDVTANLAAEVDVELGIFELA